MLAVRCNNVRTSSFLFPDILCDDWLCVSANLLHSWGTIFSCSVLASPFSHISFSRLSTSKIPTQSLSNFTTAFRFGPDLSPLTSHHTFTILPLGSRSLSFLPPRCLAPISLPVAFLLDLSLLPRSHLLPQDYSPVSSLFTSLLPAVSQPFSCLPPWGLPFFYSSWLRFCCMPLGLAPGFRLAVFLLPHWHRSVYLLRSRFHL